MKLRETAIVSAGLLIQQVTVFVTGILIARQLGATGFGELGTLRGLSIFLLIVTPLGLDLALLKHAAFYHERPGELRTVSRALRLLVATLNLAILALVAAYAGPQLQLVYQDIANFSNLCAITALGLVFAADVQVSGALYRVADRVVPYALIVNYSQPLVRLVLTGAVLAFGGGVTSIAWVNTVVFAYTFVVIAVADRGANRRAGAPAAPIELPALARRVRLILSESLWMAASLLVYQAMRFADILILAALTSAQVTGEYTAMSNVAQLIQIYPNAISQTLGPRIAVLYQAGDPAGIRDELQDYSRKAAILGGVLFGGVAVFGADLDLVFGQAFSFPWQLAVLLAAGWYVSATLAPFGYVLSMTGRHRQELAILSVGAAVLVACLPLLIPPLGSVGAALSVFIAFVAVNVIRCVRVIRILGLNPLRWQDALPPACFAGVALACSLASNRLLATRSLPHLVAECSAYLALAGLLYLVAFATEPERAVLIQGVMRRRRLS